MNRALKLCLRCLWFGMLILVVALIVISLVIVTSWPPRSTAGERKLVALLNGDPMVRLVSFETECQQRRLICRDQEALAYLEEMLMKNHQAIPTTGGGTYYAHFGFSGGESYATWIGVRTNSLDISIASMATEESWPTHSVMLTDLQSGKARQMVDFLNAMDTTVPGTVLTMRTGSEPETTRDDALIAH